MIAPVSQHDRFGVQTKHPRKAATVVSGAARAAESDSESQSIEAVAPAHDALLNACCISLLRAYVSAEEPHMRQALQLLLAMTSARHGQTP